ncbi:hypothetical protein IAT40_001203 [Kwoniella sp. CBS 6097]
MFPGLNIPNTAPHDHQNNLLAQAGAKMLDIGANFEPPKVFSEQGLKDLRHQASDLTAKAMALGTSVGESAVKLSQDAARASGEVLKHRGSALLSSAYSTVKSYAAKSPDRPIIDLSNPEQKTLSLLERPASTQPVHTPVSAFQSNSASRRAGTEDSVGSVLQGPASETGTSVRPTEGMIEWVSRFLDTSGVDYTEVSKRVKYKYYALPKPLKDAKCSCGTEKLVEGDEEAGTLLRSEKGYWVGMIDDKRVYTKSGCDKGPEVFPEILDLRSQEDQEENRTADVYPRVDDEDSDGNLVCGVISGDDDWGSGSDDAHLRWSSLQDNDAEHDGRRSPHNDDFGDRSDYQATKEGDGWTTWKPAKLPSDMNTEPGFRTTLPSKVSAFNQKDQSPIPAFPQSYVGPSEGNKVSDTSPSAEHTMVQETTSFAARNKARSSAIAEPTQPLTSITEGEGVTFSGHADRFLEGSAEAPVMTGAPTTDRPPFQNELLQSGKTSMDRHTSNPRSERRSSVKSGRTESRVSTALQPSQPETERPRPRWMGEARKEETVSRAPATDASEAPSRRSKISAPKTPSTNMPTEPPPRPRWMSRPPTVD